MENLYRISKAIVQQSKMGFMGPDILADTMKAVGTNRSTPTGPASNTKIAPVPKLDPQLGTATPANPVDQLLPGGVNAY
jgi:hypothetical protein